MCFYTAPHLKWQALTRPTPNPSATAYLPQPTEYRTSPSSPQGSGTVARMKIDCRSNIRPQIGFTLIELVITVSIVAILATVAVPNFRTFILNNRIKSTAQSLMSSFQLARSEALKRQANVAICFTDSSSACTTGTPTGWIVFADTDKDEIKDSAETIIDSKTVDSSKIYLLADQNKSLSYNSSGYPASANHMDTVVICDSRKNVDGSGSTNTSTAQSVARALDITATGRAKILTTIVNINSLLNRLTMQSLKSTCYAGG